MNKAEQEATRCVLGRDYPHPIVDHKVQREKALALYRAAQNGDGDGAESDGGEASGKQRKAAYE